MGDTLAYLTIVSNSNREHNKHRGFLVGEEFDLDRHKER